MSIAVAWSRGIEEAWSNVASFVPKLIGFLIILIIGYVIAKLIAKAVGALLERVGFDSADERGGVKTALDKYQFDASDMVGKIVFYTLFLIVLTMAFGVFGTNPISDMLEGVIAYIPNVLAAILIVVIASAIGTAAREMVDVSLRRLSYGRENEKPS
jgi:small-conductance mechanosensitive channel